MSEQCVRVNNLTPASTSSPSTCECSDNIWLKKNRHVWSHPQLQQYLLMLKYLCRGVSNSFLMLISTARLSKKSWYPPDKPKTGQRILHEALKMGLLQNLYGCESAPFTPFIDILQSPAASLQNLNIRVSRSTARRTDFNNSREKSQLSRTAQSASLCACVWKLAVYTVTWMMIYIIFRKICAILFTLCYSEFASCHHVDKK